MHQHLPFLEVLDNNQKSVFLFAIIYCLFFLDNVLLTVVVPIIPDYLFSKEAAEPVDDRGLGPASLSPLQQKFETLENDNGPLGALLASKAFVQLAATPFVGYLTEMYGSHVPLLLGSCNMLVAAILFAYGDSYGVLVLARALHGISSAAIAVSGMSILAKKVPPELRGRIMPLAFGGIALGVLIGYPLGGAAYQLMGKSAPFLLIALCIAISIILQVLFLEDDGSFNKESSRGHHDMIKWISLLKNKKILITTLTICICTSTMAILEPCIPMWLLARLNPPPTRWQLGAVFIPDSVGYFIGSHCAGFLPVASWRRAFSTLVLAGLSCCALPLADSIAQLALPHFGLGLSVGVVDASLVPLLANLVDESNDNGGDCNQYGAVYALQQVFVSLAYALGPLLGGEAVHVMGFPWLMRLVGFFNLAFCPLLLELDLNGERLGLLGGGSSYSILDISYSILSE